MSAVATATRAPARSRDAALPARRGAAKPVVPNLSHAPCACGGGCPRCTSNKLQHSRPGDASEAAAHAAADRAMRSRVAATPAAGQVPAASTLVEPAEPVVAAGLRSPGAPLDPPMRRQMEQRFGRDLGNLRIHDGSGAAASAAALRARAYTVGRDIVFGSGEYRPHSFVGQHVLAHEVAHTLQPDSPHSVRRLDMDFRIDGLSDRTGATPDTIFFDRGDSIVSIFQWPKILALAAASLQDLTLHGYTSEDTDAANRATRVTERLNSVSSALQSVGHRGARVLVPHPEEGVGDIDYRKRRAVTVSPTPVGMLSAPPTVQPSNTAGAVVPVPSALTLCENSFNAAFTVARRIANAAEAAIVKTPTPAANALVAQFFGGVPRAAVNANITAIAAQVRQLPAHHVCHTTADGGCNRPAYNSGSGLGAGGATMTICPGFVNAGDPQFQIDTLLHEASHANPVEAIEDVAYAQTRLLPVMLPADRRRNTDSYVLLMRNVDAAGSKASGPASPDVFAGMASVGAGSDTEQGERALGWLESWLNYGDFDTGLTYGIIASAVRDGHWPVDEEFNIQTMHRLAVAFPTEITDPGADGAARTILPSDRDKIRIAAIHDRFHQLYGAIDRVPLSVIQMPAGTAEAWARGPIAGPHLLPIVAVLPSFFARSEPDRVRHLVKLMVHAHTGISQPFEDLYVHALDLIRIHRRIGP